MTFYKIDSIHKYLKSALSTTKMKGNRLLQDAGHLVIILKDESNSDIYNLSIPSEGNDGYHNVSLNFTHGLKATCICPAFQEMNECKHTVAAVLSLQKYLITNPEENVIAAPQPVEIVGAGNIANTKKIAVSDIEAGNLEFLIQKTTGIRKVEDTLKVKLISPPGRDMKFKYTLNRLEDYSINLHYDGVKDVELQCTCSTKSEFLCVHQLYVLLYIQKYLSTNLFRRERDTDQDKTRILNQYGFNPGDPEAADFEWLTDFFGEVKLAKLPSYIVPEGDKEKLAAIGNSLRSDTLIEEETTTKRSSTSKNNDYELGLVLNLNGKRHLDYDIEVIQVFERSGGRTENKRLNINTANNLPLLQPLPEALHTFIMQLTDKQLLQWFESKGINYLSKLQNPWSLMREREQNILTQHYAGHIEKNWELLAAYPHKFVIPRSKTGIQHLEPLAMAETSPIFKIFVSATDKHITVQWKIKLEEDGPFIELFTAFGNAFLLADNTLYKTANVHDRQLMKQLPLGRLIFPLSDKRDVLQQVIMPLTLNYEVEIPESLKVEKLKVTPEPQLHLMEHGKSFLMLTPKFAYDKHVLDYNIKHDPQELVFSEDANLLVERDIPAEEAFFAYLRTLHPNFARQHYNPYFYLPFNEIMKKMWLLKTINQVQEAGHTVFGLRDLEHFKYNTSTPKFSISSKNNIDWFDLKISITWGDNIVTLKALRKAIMKNQNTILLDDGTIGLIPDEWVAQFSNILKIGQEDGSNLRVSKMHFTVLDEVGELNSEVREEISRKKKRLLELESVEVKPVSPNLNAQLRPYQLEGFKWMQILHELGWGGCLADDMGLGKTLQTITFLQHLKDQHNGGTQLIICPTSLIYNWQNELQKFAPQLRYHIYYGKERELSDLHFEEYDIILTSYGLVRLDIDVLSAFEWSYVILDESQAIKNPDAQVTKSLSQLKAKNRLILSGTPVQNNTYDLYAQMNFLNPGLLGSREFFRAEFANPIDKNGNSQQAAQLRKMVYPFMMRRTKQQVATDLPDKTETVLWCEMGKEQRAAYDSYRKYYRDTLLSKIDTDGINKASIQVLEGLMRLRQLCDHPHMVKDPLITTDESVKIEELMRELKENTGSNKSLVFSQFTEMLGHLRESFEREGIKYCYLDGSTPIEKRNEQVERFQNSDEEKVFLISLKAGGVGLNLTAVDYVYIVDPWWNPAAEQQAIDRTHRIGQNKKIFAYKMVCKDTIEEKILKLQDRKKSLANELISEDAAFMKKLTRDDVAFLLE